MDSKLTLSFQSYVAHLSGWFYTDWGNTKSHCMIFNTKANGSAHCTFPRLACDSDSTLGRMVKIAHLNMTGTLCLFWTSLWLVQMDTPTDSWPFIKSSQILGGDNIMTLMALHSTVSIISNMHLQVVTKTNISCALCVVVTCDYLGHGPVGLLHPALSHLHTSYELKGVCYLSTQVTKCRSLDCKISSLDLHTSLQWYTENR